MLPLIVLTLQGKKQKTFNKVMTLCQNLVLSFFYRTLTQTMSRQPIGSVQTINQHGSLEDTLQRKVMGMFDV